MANEDSPVLCEEDAGRALAFGGIAWAKASWGDPVEVAVAGMGAQWLQGAISAGHVPDFAGLMAALCAHYLHSTGRRESATDDVQLGEELLEVAGFAEMALVGHLTRARGDDPTGALGSVARATRRRDEIILELGRPPGWTTPF